MVSKKSKSMTEKITIAAVGSPSFLNTSKSRRPKYREEIDEAVVPTNPKAAKPCDCPTVLPFRCLKLWSQLGGEVYHSHRLDRAFQSDPARQFPADRALQNKCSCSGGGPRLTISDGMARNRTSSRWSAIALAVTLVLFFVSSVSSAHSHDGVSGRGCDLCHTAKLPALCLPVGPAVVLPAQADWHLPLVVFFRVLESDHLSGPSRAPPLS